MKVDLNFLRRDFSGPLRTKSHWVPERLSWTAFGGCDRALLSSSGTPDEFLESLSFLRCGVQIRDEFSQNLWWGFVDQIDLSLGNIKLTLSLSRLFNRVRVRYSFLSPDNRLADEYLTPFVEDHPSQMEYGVKEHEFQLDNLDSDRAAFFRDTFLSNHAWPESELSQLADGQQVRVQLRCLGWFHTLAWRTYANDNGFFANYGPGPGTHAFGAASNSSFPAQSFLTKGAPVELTQAFFRLRAEGNPQKNISARLHADLANAPGQTLSVSDPVFSSFSTTAYRWVKFTFSTPCTLSANTRYWISMDPNGNDGANFFHIKIDENQPFEGGAGRFYNGATWIPFPSVTTGASGQPDTYFRIVCQNDTSDQLKDLISEGGQFINRVRIPLTGRQTSPYRPGGRTCYEEIVDLMNLGTSNNRLMLASVSPTRDVTFYEQPSPDSPDLYLDRTGQLFTSQGVRVPPGPSVVGRFAQLSGINRITLPWDRHRLPACFIAGQKFFPGTDRFELRTN